MYQVPPPKKNKEAFPTHTYKQSNKQTNKLLGSKHASFSMQINRSANISLLSLTTTLDATFQNVIHWERPHCHHGHEKMLSFPSRQEIALVSFGTLLDHCCSFKGTNWQEVNHPGWRKQHLIFNWCLRGCTGKLWFLNAFQNTSLLSSWNQLVCKTLFSGDTCAYLEISFDVPPLTLDRDSKRATCSIATTVLCRNNDRDCAHVKLISWGTSQSGSNGLPRVVSYVCWKPPYGSIVLSDVCVY